MPCLRQKNHHWRAASGGAARRPVSYTHLDVYKRQDNGIETTVVAAMNDNDMVDIYVAVKDLEGSRINERTNLADVQLSGICLLYTSRCV